MNWAQWRNLRRYERRRRNLLARRRKLPLPPLLISLMETGRWTHPGDDVMAQAVPFIHDPLVVLEAQEAIIREAGGPILEAEDAFMHEYRGSAADARDLPWIDTEKTLAIMVNRNPGDDVIVALDYRTGLDAPRVVGTDWHSGKGCLHRKISPSFGAFVDLIGLSAT